MECNLKQLVGAGMCAVALLVFAMSDSLAASPGACISDEEAGLLSLIDQYRLENQLPAIPWSKSLTTVAQWHVLDAVENGDDIFNNQCNRHSWSNLLPELWSGGCYDENHSNASMMWAKPSEITAGVYPWAGFEISGWGYFSVSDVLKGWQNSVGHNNVILNQAVWTSYPWKAMGVGVDLVNRYYYVWFSTVSDPQGKVALCSELINFNSSFE